MIFMPTTFTNHEKATKAIDISLYLSSVLFDIWIYLRMLKLNKSLKILISSFKVIIQQVFVLRDFFINLQLKLPSKAYRQ